MCFSILGGREGEREVEPAILLAACLCQGNVKESLSNFLLSFLFRPKDSYLNQEQLVITEANIHS